MRLRLAQVPITHPDAARLVAEVQAEYVVRYGSEDAAPVDPAEFTGERGVFLVAYDDRVPMATGAWRRRAEAPGLAGLAAPVAEIKRMYVAAPYRRRGLARRVLAELERTAAEAGVRTLVLETGTAQPEALALYAASGYHPIPGFGHYAGAPECRSFARDLGPLSGPPPPSASP